MLLLNMSLVYVLFILAVSFQGHLMSVLGVVPTQKLDPVLGEQRLRLVRLIG